MITETYIREFPHRSVLESGLCVEGLFEINVLPGCEVCLADAGLSRSAKGGGWTEDLVVVFVARLKAARAAAPAAEVD